ncbi:MAG: glycosyltransferase family 4 protein [Bacteroidales bacterium]
MNSKYWVISEFYHPTENSTGLIITKIVDALSKKNKVNVITVGGKGTPERNNNIYTCRVNDVHVDKNNLVKRVYKLLTITILLAIKTIKNIKKNDTVIAVTNPVFMLIFLSIYRKFYKFRYILIVHDIFPENVAVLGLVDKNSFKYRLSKKFFDWAYKKADLLIPCGCDMARTISDKIGRTDGVVTIQNFSENDKIYPVDKRENTILKELGIENKFVVLFTGNIGRMQNISAIIEAAGILNNEKDIVFLFIGGGAMERLIFDYINNGGSNIKFLPSMSRDKSIDFLNAGDIGLVSLIPNIMGTGVPSKSYSYLAAGKPILAMIDDESEISDMINKYNVGWVTSPSDAESLSKLIIYLKNNPLEVADKGKLSYELSQNEMNSNCILEKFSNVITSEYSKL